MASGEVRNSQTKKVILKGVDKEGDKGLDTPKKNPWLRGPKTRRWPGCAPLRCRKRTP